MKNQFTTIILTVLITAAVIGGGVYFLMPTLAQVYMIQAHHGGDTNAMGGMHAMMVGEAAVPDGADLSQTRASTNGAFTATWSTESGTPPLNTIHSWTLHIAQPDGAPVLGAKIAINGGMPQHGHGLPTQPQMTKELGNGDYLIEGMKFQMPGYWQVIFTITAEQTDAAMFELILE